MPTDLAPKEQLIPSFRFKNTKPQGEPINTCASDPKYCPTAEDLATITALEVWAEGSEGTFHLDLQSIGAV